ncbi:transposase [Xanthomonas oryzae pv. oryzicola]|nr:transposase [Xanthomonas oryzae pv. oryzicola]
MRERIGVWLERAQRLLTQRPKDKQKLYALHAPEVECISKGKASSPYEFGVKVGIAVSARKGVIVGARSFPGNPYDGDTLAEQLEQARGLLQDVNVIPQVAIVDLGYRGRDVEGVQILHRGKAKTLTRRQWRWIKRRQAVEPVIGHLKQDCRLNRCHLNGAQGDALHVLGCAAPLATTCAGCCAGSPVCVPGCRWCGRAPQRAQASCGQQTWHLVFERVFQGRLKSRP